MKSYQNHNKDLKVKHIMYILKKITRLDQAEMMIRDSKLLIKLHHIHTMQTLEKYARISKYKIINFDDVTNENETWHNLL